MNTPTLQQVKDVKSALHVARSVKVGEKLSHILEGLEPSCYADAHILTDRILHSPHVAELNGKKTVAFYIRSYVTDEAVPGETDIDSLDGQYRWDAVLRILDELEKHCEEVENL